MTTYECEGCGKPCNEESVQISGFFYCRNCASLYGSHCAACGTLCERNELMEIGRWVQKTSSRKWEVEHVEPLCLLSYALALRAERVLQPVTELLKTLDAQLIARSRD
jgi:hypothetical protein